MPDAPRFIIGQGERLTRTVSLTSGGRPPATPYDVPEARVRIGGLVASASTAAFQLPAEACPNDFTVVAATLHPTYLAKSSYPTGLLNAASMRALGSRPVSVVPAQTGRWAEDGNGERTVLERYAPSEPQSSTQLYLVTRRDNLATWSRHLQSDDPLDPGEDQIIRLEELRLNDAADRLRLNQDEAQEVHAEIVLHTTADFVLDGLLQYAEGLDIDLASNRQLQIGGLTYMPATGTTAALRSIADYSFTRVVRSMPQMRRLLDPGASVIRAIAPQMAMAILPQPTVVAEDFRVAVFDGGLPPESPLSSWVEHHEPPDTGPRPELFTDHGQKVSSALLFGPIEPGKPVPLPYCRLDHFPVLDDYEEDDPYQLYGVLERMISALAEHRPRFVSVSVGPAFQVEDDEVHTWTSFWDTYLADGETLVTFAAGNLRPEDIESGRTRIQIPGDCVNALTVGAADSEGKKWNRAHYSAHGPGRSPGVVKPDILAFGGSPEEKFIVVDPQTTLDETSGTSFAAPLAMRAALGIRALFGDRLTPLDLKTLLIHSAEPRRGHKKKHVGWGRIAPSLEDIVTCKPGEARILYQGQLAPAKFLRASIPIPPDLVEGKVLIKATIAFTTPVDVGDAGNYTRSGLDIRFRPNATKPTSEGSSRAKTDEFFRKHKYEKESELRAASQKWETVMSAKREMKHHQLNNPVFDIHYIAREAGQDTKDADPIPYCMVLTISHNGMPDLYEKIIQTYATHLEALAPVRDIEIGATPGQ